MAVEKFQHSPLVMNCILGQQAYTYLIPKVMNISMTNQNHGLGYSFPQELNQHKSFRRLLDVLLCAAHLSFISPGFTIICSSSD